MIRAAQATGMQGRRSSLRVGQLLTFRVGVFRLLYISRRLSWQPVHNAFDGVQLL